MNMKKIIIVSVMMTLLMIGSASADPVINILPSSGPNVLPDGTIEVPVGSDAFTTIGLSASYTGWVAGNAYSVQVIRDSDGTVVFNHVHSGGLPAANYIAEIHWIPAGDLGQTYTVDAWGITSSGRRTWKVETTAPVNPTPELPTSALMAVGLIGLIGVSKLRRKN